MNYDLELEKTAREIVCSKANQVLIQIPDGLKPYAEKIVEFLEKNTKAEIFIWFGDCYGGCDLPPGIGNLGIDFIIQFGHNKFNKSKKW